jgi:hypothetical protein
MAGCDARQRKILNKRAEKKKDLIRGNEAITSEPGAQHSRYPEAGFRNRKRGR